MEKLRGGEQYVERGGFRLWQQADGPAFMSNGVVIFIDSNTVAELRLLRGGGQIIVGIG